MQNMYINPALTVPPGPDGMPPAIDPRESQEHFEVRCCTVALLLALVVRPMVLVKQSVAETSVCGDAHAARFCF